MNILLQGQLAVTSGQQSIDIAIDEDSSIENLIHKLASMLPNEAQALILTDDGKIRSSLFVAIDGEHQRDYSSTLPATTTEIMLMPPMAGG